MELKTGTPCKEGVSTAAIEQMFDYWEKNGAFPHVCAILKNGKLIRLQEWKPYSAGQLHMLNSVSKTFTSIALMFAVQEGYCTPDTFLVDIFPERAEKLHVCEYMKKLKLKHLLTMTTGHFPENADFIYETEEPLDSFLASELSVEPGTKFNYNTGATYILSLVIRKLTGKSLYDYLNEHFFKPLGIEGAVWESDRKGNSYGGFGLNLNVIDVAKTGQFLLNRGKWEGVQLLNAELIDMATGVCVLPEQMRDWSVTFNNSDDVEHNDWGCGYGWQMWNCTCRDAYRADGAFGQYCVVVPEFDLVVTVFSGSDCSHHLLNGIWNCLIPALEKKDVSDTSPAGRYAVCADGSAEPQTENAKSIIGRTFDLPANGLGITSLCVEDPGKIRITRSEQSYILNAANKENIYNDLEIERPSCTYPFIMRMFGKLACSYGFTEDSYVLRMLCVEYAYYQEICITQMEDGVKIKMMQYPAGDTEEFLV